MAENDETEVEEVAEAEGGEEEGGKRKLSGKKLVLLVVLPALLVLGGGGGAAAWFMGMFDGGGAQVAYIEDEKPILFYEMPELLVNLSSEDRRSQYLKLKIALEMTDAGARNAIEPLMPRILDIFQIYLRELRREDLDGSAGVYRLKEELVRRINLVISPRQIDRVLFREIVVQ